MIYYKNDELCHHGIFGMKWGVRRFQNPNGTLTEAGKKRYSEASTNPRTQKKMTRRADRVLSRHAKQYNLLASGAKNEKTKKYYEKNAKFSETKLSELRSGQIKAGRDFITRKDVNFSYLIPDSFRLDLLTTVISEHKEARNMNSVADIVHILDDLYPIHNTVEFKKR